VIACVTGAPGSGKSYYCTRKIADSLDAGKYVATNVTMVRDWERQLASRNQLSRLIPGRVEGKASRYAERSHYTDSLAELMGVGLGCQVCGDRPDPDHGGHCLSGHRLAEGRGVAVIDEAHEWLNNRTWDAEDRGDFVRWFSLHRKLGWDTYLITQHIDSIDKQIRDRVEFHIVLRNIKRMKFAGIPLVPVNAFLAIHVWLQGPKAKRHISKRELFFLDGRRKLYDTMGLHGIDLGESAGIWLPHRAPLLPASGSDFAVPLRSRGGEPVLVPIDLDLEDESGAAAERSSGRTDAP
jgi:hypothetical protein